MVDERLRTQKFFRGLRPELWHPVIATCVVDMEVVYQAEMALEEDLLRTQE